MRAIGLAILAILILASQAFSLDLNELYKTRCERCHQDVRQLVHAELIIDTGILRSRTSGDDIRLFLPDHYGHPNPAETAALYDLLFRELKGRPIVQRSGRGGFEERCAICHVSALELARLELIRDGNVVRGRYSGRELPAFLAGHGRISADELAFFVQLLTPLAPER